VVLQATISKTGTIEGLHVISGPAMLQQAPWMREVLAVQALPAQQRAGGSGTTVNVVFTLVDEEPFGFYPHFG